MAYQFPVGYQQMYYPQYPSNYNQQINQQQNTQQSSLIWVQGEAGAKSYMVAPNTTIALWDSEAQTVYLKSADASGMPSMRILDYVIRDNAPASHKNGSQIDYATKDDISTLEKEIEQIKANMWRRKERRNEPTVSADER